MSKKLHIIISTTLICLLVCASTLSACGKKGTDVSEPEESKMTTENNSDSSDLTESKEKPDGSDDSNSASDIPAPSTCGALAVSGTQLEDETGNPVQLRGVSTHGLAWFPDYVNEDLFRELHEEWKVSVIRLAMYTAESGGYCTDGNQEQLKEFIRKGVEYATNQDMYVIIDWHILSDGNPNQNRDEAIRFFTEMSQEFAPHNNVLYEICNEPNGGTSWADIKSYALEVIPAIRQNDPDAVILVGTPNWSQYVNEAAEDPITEYNNLMYTLHFYAATHTDSLRSTMTDALQAGLPIFVSEFGICDASGNGGIDDAQANTWIQLLDENQVSYVAWNLSNKDETSALFQSSVTKTSDFGQEDLSDSGKWLYQVLTKEASINNGQSNATDSTSSSRGVSSQKNPSQGTVSQTGEGTVINDGDIQITAVVVNSWESNGEHFYQYTLTLKNISKKDMANWEISLRFNERIDLSDSWNGSYSASGSKLTISSVDYNGAIKAGQEINDVGFIVSGESGPELQSD